jgi:hypothetical protein
MPFSPLFMKDVIFETGDPTAVDYAAELSSVLLEPESDTVTWKGLKPTSTFTESTPPTWAATLKYAQDWDAADSFGRWLWDNQGTTQAVSFRPKSGSGPTFTANLTIVSGPIGGDVDTYAESEVTLGSDIPVLVPAA